MIAALKKESFIGLDVGAEELMLLVRSEDKSGPAQAYKNTPSDHQRIIKKVKQLGDCIVCLEATGVYSMDIAIALFDANIRVMVINPQSSHNFAKVLGKHSKTDAVDADTLAQYAQRMPFQHWVRPSNSYLQLRVFSRRIYALTKQKSAAKNQSHALSATDNTPKEVLQDVKLAITQLENRIASLSKKALALIHADPALEQAYQHLVAMTGFGDISAVSLLGELLLLPSGMSHTQWVKFAGLDPKHFRSGTSVDKKARISKAGNHYIRAALYMPAMSAKAHDPYVKAYFQHLLTMGKTPMQGLCAVMRKLLHALHGMLTNNAPFDNTRFYAIPTENNTVLA
jgi:transposase